MELLGTKDMLDKILVLILIVMEDTHGVEIGSI